MKDKDDLVVPKELWLEFINTIIKKLDLTNDDSANYISVRLHEDSDLLTELKFVGIASKRLDDGYTILSRSDYIDQAVESHLYKNGKTTGDFPEERYKNPLKDWDSDE